MPSNIVSGDCTATSTSPTFKMTRDRLQTERWLDSSFERYVTRQSVKEVFDTKKAQLIGGLSPIDEPGPIWLGLYRGGILRIGCIVFDRKNTAKIRAWIRRKHAA